MSTRAVDIGRRGINRFHLFFRSFLNRPERLQEIGGGYDTAEIIGFINHGKTVNSLRQHLSTAKESSVFGFTVITSRVINWLTEVVFQWAVRASTRKISLSETTPTSLPAASTTRKCRKECFAIKLTESEKE